MADSTASIATNVNHGIEWDGRLISEATQIGAGALVTRIESILESTLDCLSEKQELSIELASRRSLHRRGDAVRMELVRFPGRTLHEAKKFARLLLILQLSHDALVSGTILTKRFVDLVLHASGTTLSDAAIRPSHIFYQHQELFEKQSRVDELVDDLALTLGVTRDGLNIVGPPSLDGALHSLRQVATAKGILSGPLTIRLYDDTLLDASSGDLGIQIPLTASIANIDANRINWVLVVEKDATFRSLSSSQFCQTSMFGPGLLMTAKGYPDLITRSFLHVVHEKSPQLPIFVLVDFDPDGLNIFRCYRYGSDSVGQRTVSGNPGIKWLGIKSSQILELDATVSEVDELTSNSQSSAQSSGPRFSISSTACREPISQLSARDRKSAIGTLGRLSEVVRDDDEEALEVRRELQVMLMMGVKAEIQWLDDSGNTTDWVDNKIGGFLSAGTTTTSSS